jgi:hypothetical protein
MSNKLHRSERDQLLDRYVTWGIIVGVLLGIAVFVIAVFFRPWQQMKVPPENATELLAFHTTGFESGTLYIRTTSGNVYAYSPFSDGASNVEWRKVEQVNREESSYECKLGAFPTPNPPDRILSQLESHPCLVDGESQVNFIVLENGSVWKWEGGSSELDLLLIPVGIVAAVIGGSLGVVVGLLIGIVNWKYRKK